MRYSILTVYFFICLKTVYLHGQKSGPHKTENSRLNFFDTDLLRYSAEDRPGNVMVSPASIKSTLAMILEGAGGATAVEIQSALRLSPNKDEFREQLNLYLKGLQVNTNTTQLRNANAMFVSKKFRLKKEYEVMLEKVYMTDVYNMDFKDPGPASEIVNNWVNNATKGLIPSIIEPVNINPSSSILFTNAIYFKSAWQYKFNPRETSGSCFHLRGVCRSVAMMEMHAELNYAYIDSLRAHALELPYEGKRYSMILLVPQERDGCAPLIRDLPYVSLPQIAMQLEPTDIMLTLPKFSIDYSEDLVGALQAMHIKSLFSATANLSGIFVGDSPQINNIYHKVHMTVDESGTEAAAATAAMVIPLIQGSVQLAVDRPFVFFIRDNTYGFVIFEGRIEEPTVFVEKNGFLGSQATKTQRNSAPKRYYG